MKLDIYLCKYKYKNLYKKGKKRKKEIIDFILEKCKIR